MGIFWKTWTFVFTTVFIICCSRNDKSVEDSTCTDIQIRQNDIHELVNASDIFDEIWRVPLETHNDNIIGNIDRLLVHDSILYVLDGKQDMVFLFTTDGRYIAKIENKGSGPNEYLAIDDAYIISAKNELIICDMMRHKLMHYSLFGEFLSEEKNPVGDENFYCMTELPNGNMFYYIGQKNSYNRIFEEHNAIMLTPNGEIIPFFPEVEGELKLAMASTDSYLFGSGEDVFLHIPFHNEIYKIEGNGISKSYEIDVLNKMFPDEAFYSPTHEYFFSKYIENENYISIIGSIIASRNFIIIPMLKGMKFYGNIWISRRTNKVFVAEKILDDQKNEIELIARGAKGDTIICMNIDSSPEEMDANPVLIFCRLKDF